ncbi:M56 family metallopeptidase [Pedobacter punctiformis]|uniref:M56 family metallopeptidase n=1 Tax=Pedobacter punctiformis TaxID=3004097 RepID=A0ABT4LBA5_9SPHI|nr:M56 family metallopeptidase [Pedobacter sp. HCMS5-2]MCZ4245200.1 M56 family metallopeptidase [Pedobacter sp. HCMS5-2]
MEWLTYLLEVSVCTTLFFGFYLLVLRKLTFFKINRFYLILSLLLSLIIPAFQVNIEKAVEPLPVVNVQPGLTVQEEEPTQPPLQVMPAEDAAINWFAWLEITYILVAVALMLICLWQLFQLLKHTKEQSQNINGSKLISKQKGFTNCSFFNYVFINQDYLTESELQVLLKHEQVHASQYHSADKILMMICKAVLWFNPVIYLYNKALEQNHEYEADEVTSLSFGNKDYANLLLKLAIAKSDMPLVHNFVKSPVKERIKMLFHSKSKNMKKLMYLLVLPIAIGLIWLFTVQVVYAQAEIKHDKTFQDTLKKPLSKNKELALPDVKQTDPYFTSKDYLDKLSSMNEVHGKTISGAVVGEYKIGEKSSFMRGYLFKSGEKTYVL